MCDRERRKYIAAVGGNPCGTEKRYLCQTCEICVDNSTDGSSGLKPRTMGGRGNSGTVYAVRRGFIEAAVMAPGHQASEVAGFLGCHPSKVSCALQKRGRNI